MVAIAVPVAVLIFLGGNAVYDKIALVISVESSDDVEHGGFSRAALAEYGHKFVFPEAKGHSVQRPLNKVARFIDLDDVFQFKHNYLLFFVFCQNVTTEPLYI